jgi:7-cyano-7-deazaguanine synthase
LTVAAGYAESLEASSVIVGFNREEAATFPDNSISYLVAIEKALFYSTKNHVKVICPTRTLDKKQIVRLAKERNFPFELLWSCYQNGNKMCGKCESCQRLKRAANGQMVGWENYFEDASLSG